MILGDVEETATVVEVDDETYEEIVKVREGGGGGEGGKGRAAPFVNKRAPPSPPFLLPFPDQQAGHALSVCARGRRHPGVAPAARVKQGCVEEGGVSACPFFFFLDRFFRVSRREKALFFKTQGTHALWQAGSAFSLRVCPPGAARADAKEKRMTL
jgi:hypothetical protein